MLLSSLFLLAKGENDCIVINLWLPTTPKGEIVVPSVRIGVCIVVVGTDIKAFVSWHVLRQF